METHLRSGELIKEKLKNGQVEELVTDLHLDSFTILFLNVSVISVENWNALDSSKTCSMAYQR